MFGSKVRYCSAVSVNKGLSVYIMLFSFVVAAGSHCLFLRVFPRVLLAGTRLMGKFTVRNCHHAGYIVFGGFLVRVVRFGLGSRLALRLNKHPPSGKQNGHRKSNQLLYDMYNNVHVWSNIYIPTEEVVKNSIRSNTAVVQ